MALTIKSLAWATDIHLDMADSDTGAGRAFGEQVADEGAEALLVTGDIAIMPSLSHHLHALASGFRASATRPIYFVLGNHDYWMGTFERAHTVARSAARHSDGGLVWLRDASVVALNDHTALVGIDGLYDGGYGDPHGGLRTNDFAAIKDLDGLQLRRCFEVLAERARTDARILGEHLQDACEVFRRVIVATHVPPFVSTIRHRDYGVSAAVLPYYGNKIMGDMLRGVAEAYPETQILVLSGHTHMARQARVLSNLHARVGGAEYSVLSVADTIRVDDGWSKWWREGIEEPPITKK